MMSVTVPVRENVDLQVRALVREVSPEAFERFKLHRAAPFSMPTLKANGPVNLAKRLIEAHNLATHLKQPLSLEELRPMLMHGETEFQRELENHIWKRCVRGQIMGFMAQSPSKKRFRWTPELEAELSDLELHRLFEGLSPRQRNVAYLSVLGYDRKSIATILGISVRTIPTHMAEIRESILPTIQDALETSKQPLPNPRASPLCWVNAWRQLRMKAGPLEYLLDHPRIGLNDRHPQTVGDPRGHVEAVLYGKRREDFAEETSTSPSTVKNYSKPVKEALGKSLERAGMPRIGFTRLANFFTFVAYHCPPAQVQRRRRRARA